MPKGELRLGAHLPYMVGLEPIGG